MRMITFVEAVLVMIAFMIVFLLILTDRSTQRIPTPKLVPVPARRPAKRVSVRGG